MPKFKIPLHILVPDTNALFAKEIAQIARESFAENLKKCRELAPIKVYIPEVVREEIVFQKFYVACKSNENANISLKNLEAIIKTPAPKPRSETYLKQRVRAVFNLWLKTNDARVIKTPYTHIKWSKLADGAVWRKPPFSPNDENNPESEKGFRDALILETFREICRTNPTEHIVFVTNDKLLRQAAEGLRLTGKITFSDGIKEFWSNLKLLHDNRTKEFATTLLTNAPRVFYEKDNLNCIYNKINIPVEISKRFGQTINSPQDKLVPAPQFGVPGPVLAITNPWASLNLPVFNMPNTLTPPASIVLPENLTRVWKPASDDKYLIGQTNFQKILDGRTFWQTRLEVVRVFGHDGPATAIAFLGTDDRIRIAQVDVIWNALTSEDAELSDWKVEDIKLAAIIFEPLGAEFRAKYNFAGPLRYMPLPAVPNPQPA